MEAWEIVFQLEDITKQGDVHISDLYNQIAEMHEEIWNLLQENEDLKREVTQLIAENINLHARKVQ